MPGHSPALLARSTVDDGVADALDETSGDALAVARRTVEDPGDRWHGRLVAAAHDAVGAPHRPESVLPAAVSIELLRGYCRLRASLLTGAAAGEGGRSGADRSTALLAGDYLHARAFLELHSLPDPAPETGYGVLTDALESIRGGLRSAFAGSDSSSDDPASLVEQTVGSVAQAAVGLGVSLGDAGRSEAVELGRVGRDLATSRGLRELRDAVHRAALDVPFGVDDGSLRREADRRQADASRRLRGLRGEFDVQSVRHLARAGDRHARQGDARR